MVKVWQRKQSLYDLYKNCAKCLEETERYKKVSFETDGKIYSVYVSKKCANFATHILCGNDDTIYWEQFIPFGGRSSPQKEKYVFVRPERTKGETVLVLLRGKPSMIKGLDENGFVSEFGKEKSESDIFVMTESAWKRFEKIRSMEISK